MNWFKNRGVFENFSVFCLLILFPLFISIPVLNRFTTNEDEGISLYGAVRILESQIPYRDFWHITLPGSVWTIAGAFYLFGATLLTARILTFLIITGEGIVVFLIGRKLTEKTLYPLFASIFVFLFNLVPSINFTPHKPAVLFSLIGFYLVLRKSYLLSAISLSLSTSFQQNTGVLSAIGVFLFILTERFVKEKQDEQFQDRWLKNLISFTLTFLFPFVIFAIYLLATDSFKDAFYTLAVWPFRGYTAFNRYPYFNCEKEIFARALNLNGGVLQVLSNFSGLGTLLFIGYLPLLFFPFFIFYSVIKKNVLFYFLSLTGTFLFLSSFTRPDFLHVLYTLPVFFLLFFLTIALAKDLKNKRTNIFLKVVRGFFMVFVFMILFERAVGFLNVLATPNETLKTVRGDIRVPLYTAQSIKPLFEFIEKNTKKGDRIFIYHWSPALYFYLDRDNATKFDAYKPVLNSKNQVEDILRSLKENPPALIIRDDYIERIINPDHPRSLSCTFPMVNRRALMEDNVDEWVSKNTTFIVNTGPYRLYKILN